jgi:hypothetical protein
MIAPPPSLTYARARPPWYRRLAFRRGLLVGLLIAASLGVAFAWRGAPGQWARANYWYWVCAHHTDPPNKIVYAYNDPEAQATILADGGVRSIYLPAEAFIPSHSMARLLQVHRLFQSTCFLHERRGIGKARKLVAIDIDRRWPGDILLTPSIYSRSTGARPSDEFFSGYDCMFSNSGGPVCIYAGQPDPTDPARFTIRYCSNGQPGVIEGFLRADDQVDLQIISGPATIHYQLNGEGARLVPSSD